MMNRTVEHELTINLRNGLLEHQPWTHFYAEQALPEALASALASSFGHFELTPCEEHQRSKSYQFATAPLDTREASASSSEEWQVLIDTVLGRAYREFISDLMSTDLNTTRTTLSLWEYRSGDWLAPHLDKPEKLVTQIIYLTPEWREGDGGRLLILENEDSSHVTRALAPSLGSSAILLRSEHSWHAVEAPREGSRPRRSLTVTFWKDT